MHIRDITSKTVREEGIHEVFVISIVVKAIAALFESIIGAMLLWTNSIVGFVLEMMRNEVLEDPDGFFASHLHSLLNPSHETQVFGGLYLLSHGVVKLALATGLLFNKMWAYPASLAVFALFIVYQLIRFVHTRSIWLLVLTVVDLIVMWLIWHEYRIRQGKSVIL